jgi:hypothetical protein
MSGPRLNAEDPALALDAVGCFDARLSVSSRPVGGSRWRAPGLEPRTCGLRSDRKIQDPIGKGRRAPRRDAVMSSARQMRERETGGPDCSGSHTSRSQSPTEQWTMWAIVLGPRVPSRGFHLHESDRCQA